MLKETPKVIIDHLNSLKTPDEIAAFCRQRGVKGVRYNIARCVLANVVPGEVEVDAVFDVSPGSIPGETYSTSFIVRQFFAKFDVGEYPDLIED